jgi:UDP-GlcNAc:undecaprenyl-phosphate/decaprenyl-phosphate GlcNAc-1-phosphate transferase
MTTLLATFGVALILSLILTPLAGRLGLRFGAADEPDERKVHEKIIPRSGGAAIFVVFLFALLITRYFNTNISNLLVLDRSMVFLFFGAIVCFGIGLIDDFYRLGPKIKFLFQIVAASIAYWGGIRIGGFDIFGVYLEAGYLSYALTVFWFVIFINAVNLIDGLDGLAGGIVVFASVVMVILSVLREEYLTAMMFMALGGSVLGFLRYNFNPATIFLGDGGSYFLGYTVAGLSILGSVKTQLGAAMLIPLLALGVPLFDAVLSPIRRFILGKDMFRPDKEHVHHRLVAMGLTAQKAVWLIYGISFCLCLIALAMINIRDERAGLFLIVLGAGAIIFTRKLGYFEYFASDKLYGWFKDISDSVGISRDRRSFLSLQVDMGRSENFSELQHHIISAIDKLEFDMAEFKLSMPENDEKLFHPESAAEEGNEPEKSEKNWRWAREAFDRQNGILTEDLLKLRLPLLGDDNTHYGTLLLLKDLKRDPISHYTLRRVEHLRRTVVQTIKNIYRNGFKTPSNTQ